MKRVSKAPITSVQSTYLQWISLQADTDHRLLKCTCSIFTSYSICCTKIRHFTYWEIQTLNWKQLRTFQPVLIPRRHILTILTFRLHPTHMAPFSVNMRRRYGSFVRLWVGLGLTLQSPVSRHPRLQHFMIQNSWITNHQRFRYRDKG